MKLFYTAHFKRSFKKFSPEIQNKFGKQIKYLLQGIDYPSLQAKKYDERNKVWQARVDESVRFYFLIKKGSYVLLEIRQHPKLIKNPAGAGFLISAYS